MSEMLLLGAGASREAEIPTAYEMTGRILTLFQEWMPHKKHARILSFVVGGLLFEKSMKGENPLACGVNVEELFNAIDLLSKRKTLEVTPFVGSWHSMVDEFDQITPPTADADKVYRAIYDNVTSALLKALGEAPPAFGARDIDGKLERSLKKVLESVNRKTQLNLNSSDSLGREIHDYLTDWARKWTDKIRHSYPNSSTFSQEFEKAVNQQPKPAQGRVFHEVTEAMIEILVKLVWIDGEKEESDKRIKHLRPIINLLRRQGRLVIATLNYDNAIEKLATSTNVNCHNGMNDWSTTGNFNFCNDGINLLKLHGSIDWALKRHTSGIDSLMPHSKVEQVDPLKVSRGAFRPAVIFGQRNKLTVEGPFLDLLRAFKQELFKSNILTVVGYSFADGHINEYISQWLNHSPSNKIQIVDVALDKSNQPYVKNLLKINATQPSRISIITAKAGDGLQTLYGAAEN